MRENRSGRRQATTRWPPVHSTDPFFGEPVPPTARAQQSAGDGRDRIGVIPDSDRGVETFPDMRLAVVGWRVQDG